VSLGLSGPIAAFWAEDGSFAALAGNRVVDSHPVTESERFSMAISLARARAAGVVRIVAQAVGPVIMPICKVGDGIRVNLIGSLGVTALAAWAIVLASLAA